MQSRRPSFAHALFFPAAALHAALLVPWWTAGRAGLLPGPALDPLPWLLASSLLWSAAFLILFAVLIEFPWGHLRKR